MPADRLTSGDRSSDAPMRLPSSPFPSAPLVYSLGDIMLDRLNRRLRAGKSDEGFTLIELLIVIVILGILAAIVVFAIGKTRGDAVASGCKTDFKSIELASEAYYTKNGSYPVQADFDIAGKTLLKSFPSSADYSFTYAAGVITVKDKAGATVATNPTTSAGCD